MVGKANQRIIADRLDWVQRMEAEIRSLPLGSLAEFISDRRNVRKNYTPSAPRKSGMCGK
jgi:hypothetical protein